MGNSQRNTLLSTNLTHPENWSSITLIGEDKEYYEQGDDIFINNVFPYSNAERYDKEKTNNDIKLVVRYKNMLFEAYTDFTFPKDGDPGTNNTDFVRKISLSTGAERLYGREDGYFFDSFGNEVDSLDYTLYNNGIPYGIDVDKVKWQIPPRIDQDKVQKSRSRFTISNY